MFINLSLIKDIGCLAGGHLSCLNGGICDSGICKCSLYFTGETCADRK